MVDAVQSGGYGVLGLYAAQAPTVPEPATQPTAAAGGTAANPLALAAVSTAEAAQQVGSEPVPAASAGAGSGQTLGRDYFGGSQAQTRQAAVAASLYGSVQAGTGTTTSSTSSSAATPSGRAARAYAKTGSLTASGPTRTGSMLSSSV